MDLAVIMDGESLQGELFTFIMNRLLNIVISSMGLMVLSSLFLVVALIVKLSSRGPVFHVSKRVGKENRIFEMMKFRTMRMNTPQVATHLMVDAASFVTPVGRFLRKTSLDEIPQLINVLMGDMAIVGPRPALFNQDDLIALRTQKGIHVLTPGLTGWAQINGRDDLPIPVKVQFDEYYLKNRSLWLDLKIILLTVVKVVRREGVKH